MGNSKSINIEEKSNGIFKINLVKYPEYPIAYIRLCWDKKTSKYCMAQECDILKKCVEHRKFIIVGMRIPELSKENIFEQAFYLSSGLNSINSLNNNFKTKFIVKNESENIWLPFSGFGYDYNDLTYRDNLNTNIKLLKNNFGHGCPLISNNCLYGRFGQYDPNLIQISYCLGGDFWENNIDNIVFNKYKIIKYPTLENMIGKISPGCFEDDYITNIECSIYLNNYIGSALSLNYSPELLKSKLYSSKQYSKFSPISGLSYYDDIKLDYRIINILYDNKIYLFEKKGIQSPLPFENTFGGNILWNNYFKGINTIFKENNKIFETMILPIINEEKIPDDIEENKTNLIGTFENPYESRKDSKNIGDYYYIGKKIVQKKK